MDAINTSRQNHRSTAGQDIATGFLINVRMFDAIQTVTHSDYLCKLSEMVKSEYVEIR